MWIASIATLTGSAAVPGRISISRANFKPSFSASKLIFFLCVTGDILLTGNLIEARVGYRQCGGKRCTHTSQWTLRVVCVCRTMLRAGGGAGVPEISKLL